MPRTARIVVPGCPHHVTQCGNNRQPVFFGRDDYRVYLDLLVQRTAAADVDLLGYCLMPNHVHLILTPRSAPALARALGRTHFLYTQYVNRLHRRSGHLWQNRFFSCPLDDAYLWTAMRHVERNPLRAGLARRPEAYPWSSAAAHVGRVAAPAWLAQDEWSAVWTPTRWRAALQTPPEDAEVTRMRRHLHTGRPLGSDSFVSKLEHKLGRRLRPLKVGRPKKAAKPHRRVESRLKAMGTRK